MRFRAPILRLISYIAVFFWSPSSAEQNPVIEKIEIRGTTRPLELETRAGQALNTARLAGDVRRLWSTGSFHDIRVESRDTPAGIALVFRVVEKPRLFLRRVRLEPAEGARAPALPRGLRIDRVSAAQLAARMRRELAEDGYRDATVHPELVRVGSQEVDLRLRVERGRRYRLRQLRFAGDLGLPLEELQRAARAARRRAFSERSIEAALDQLRSLYLSRGYFEPKVRLGEVKFSEGEGTVQVMVEAGARRRVRQLEVITSGSNKQLLPASDGALPAVELCRCLQAAQRNFEKQGVLDLNIGLEVALAPPNGADVTARIEPGPAYTVGRIEFRGHRAVGDLTLRRALLIEEGEWLDRARLRRSLARLNRLGLFEPVSEADVAVARNPQQRFAHLTISLKQRPRGRWSLSGPFGPRPLAGPFQFALGSRLPNWGPSAWQTSTYFASFSFLSFSPLLLRWLPGAPRAPVIGLFALDRPYLAGQGWQSAFRASPQLGWRETLAGYGSAQLLQFLHTRLQGDGTSAPALLVPMERGEGFLLCEAAQPRLGRLRQAGAMAAGWLLAAPSF